MWAMTESVPVRCPACRREHLYAAPSFPCVCGAPVAPPLDRRGTATAVTHHSWAEDWITLRCGSCGRLDEWPHPELGCPCGTVLRIAVAEPAEITEATDATEAMDATEVTEARKGTVPRAVAARETTTARPKPRRPFQPVTIRTARDAVTAAAVYLRWLGYRDIRRADQRPPTGIGIAARGLVAQVDPTVRPASLRDVECLWLTAMTESADCAYFSLAGYTPDARTRAGTLGVPLFVLDLTGTPQPVNSPADELDGTGA
ncbi:hypothetical protein LXH13_31185 [Streptomyces spinosirectus]|jgi:hypothetical protein|uniref:hypothetical protein n=2 Tax=Streptomyces TaxID=1883 RepID=UPI0013E89C86|nr:MULTISPECIES: hypothetical protein [Streptomyces]MBY8340619.1 hypothetical protein [Streptomyces plumbidurans]UIR21240.1 hypothetical protein LXH13_31185 [Streptomyces spinosirectus]